MREFLVKKAHNGSLMGRFRVKKTLEMRSENFYLPKMKIDIDRVCSRCITCKKSKSKILPQWLYTSLPITSEP